MRIYLDNASTTRPDDRVVSLTAEMEREFYANDASVHAMGVEAAKRTEQARASIAAAVNACPAEMFFTSGGTESNNLALFGAAAAARGAKKHIVISGIEHPSVHEPALRLERMGVHVTVVAPSRGGLISPSEIKKAIRPETLLVSVIHASNETGVIQPAEEIGSICRRAGVIFHSDACQSFAKTELDVNRQCIDLLTLNSHKIHGPKGVGALYVRKGTPLGPLMAGGGQERGLRPGTRNCPAIAGFGLAASLATSVHSRKMREMRDSFWKKLRASLPEARLNCEDAPRLCGILSITIGGISGAAALLRALTAKGIFLSAGSACSSGKNEPSRVLKAVGLSDAEALRTIRVSLGRFNTPRELSLAAREISRAVLSLRGVARAA